MAGWKPDRLLASAIVILLVLTLLPPASQAGSETEIALGLASFAVFNQLFRPWVHHGPGYRGHYHPPYAAVYPHRHPYAYPQYVVVVPPPPPPQPTVQYPHGRYELRGDGVTTAYQWVWIANPPPPAPPAPKSP